MNGRKKGCGPLARGGGGEGEGEDKSLQEGWEALTGPLPSWESNVLTVGSSHLAMPMAVGFIGASFHPGIVCPPLGSSFELNCV